MVWYTHILFIVLWRDLTKIIYIKVFNLWLYLFRVPVHRWPQARRRPQGAPQRVWSGERRQSAHTPPQGWPQVSCTSHRSPHSGSTALHAGETWSLYWGNLIKSSYHIQRTSQMTSQHCAGERWGLPLRSYDSVSSYHLQRSGEMTPKHWTGQRWKRVTEVIWFSLRGQNQHTVENTSSFFI